MPAAAQTTPATSATGTRRRAERGPTATGPLVSAAPRGASAIPSSARSTSSADCGRSAGCFSSSRITSAPSDGGTAARRRSIGSGVCVACAARSCCAERPSNGGRPASSSYATHAERVEIGAMIDVGSPAACSGAMYAGVPSDVPTRDVERRASSPPPRRRRADRLGDAEVGDHRARRRDSSMFSGLMSRCTIALRVRVARARSPTSRRMRIAVGHRQRAVARRAARAATRLRRTASCSTAPRLDSPAASSGTMCGCCSRAASSDLALEPLGARVPRRARARSTFTTTLRPSAASSATKTRDIPPPPSSRSTCRRRRASAAGDRECPLRSRRIVVRRRGERSYPTSHPASECHAALGPITAARRFA